MQHERGPRKPKLHSALLTSQAHQTHLQMSLVTSVSAYAQSAIAASGGHPSSFHPVHPHIHHPQPLPFTSIVHPAHSSHHLHPHSGHHHSHLLPVPPPSNDFYKNSHIPSIVPSVLPQPIPLLSSNVANHASLPPQIPVSTSLTASSSIVPSSHSTFSHHPSFHYSPPSPTQTIKSNASSIIEPSHDSVESPPLIVDNVDHVASPISVSSNSNNNNNITNSNKNETKNNNDTDTLANSNGADDSHKADNATATNSTLRLNGLHNDRRNSLLDILMNPDKCQVGLLVFTFFQLNFSVSIEQIFKNIVWIVSSKCFRNSFNIIIRCFFRRHHCQTQRWTYVCQLGRFCKKPRPDCCLWPFGGCVA